MQGGLLIGVLSLRGLITRGFLTGAVQGGFNTGGGLGGF